MAFHLTDRTLLGLKGADSFDFLQSVITNDMELLKEKTAIYTAHLTTKGKFLYDFFISQMGDMYVIDCNKTEMMHLARALHSYVVNKDVEFHDLSEDYTCVASDSTLEETTLAYDDPRSTELGVRNWVKNAPEDCESVEAYHEKRINLGVIDGAFDGLKERTLANELCLEHFNGVSFNKGCYVGQELTARTKFRTEPKKRVFKVEIEGEVENGSAILCGNMDAGWVFSNKNGVGIAIIRTRYLGKEMTLGGKPITYTDITK